MNSDNSLYSQGLQAGKAAVLLQLIYHGFDIDCLKLLGFSSDEIKFYEDMLINLTM